VARAYLASREALGFPLLKSRDQPPASAAQSAQSSPAPAAAGAAAASRTGS